MSWRCGSLNWQKPWSQQPHSCGSCVDSKLICKCVLVARSTYMQLLARKQQWIFWGQKIWCWTSFQLFWFLFGDSPDSLILWTLHSGLHIKDPSFRVFICFSFLIFTFGLIIETRSVTRSSASIRVRCECVKCFYLLKRWSALKVVKYALDVWKWLSNPQKTPNWAGETVCKRQMESFPPSVIIKDVLLFYYLSHLSQLDVSPYFLLNSAAIDVFFFFKCKYCISRKTLGVGFGFLKCVICLI